MGEAKIRKTPKIIPIQVYEDLSEDRITLDELFAIPSWQQLWREILAEVAEDIARSHDRQVA